MIYVSICQRDASAQSTEPITTGSVGLLAGFQFSDDWRGLGKTAVFRGSGVQVDAALTTDSCRVPHEVLTKVGGHLKIGVYGTGENGRRVTPTVWADAGEIREGAEPAGIEETPAAASLIQQLLEEAQAAREIAQSLRDDADSGAFDGAEGPTGPQGAKGDKGETGATGPQGPKGDAGEGLPPGGSAGQVLVKASDSDYDGKWADPSGFTDEIEAELAALDPDIHSEAYTWTLGRNYNSAGSLGTQNGFAITQYFHVTPGTLFVNRSVPVDGAGKNTQVFIHQFSGSTWLRRKGLMSEPHFVAIDDDADRVRIAFGYPSDQGVTITQQMIDENFAIRIVKKAPEEASDVGAVAANQGSANAGKVLTVGADGAVSPQDAAGGDNVFCAQYGTTTSAEINAAVQAGKAVYCVYDNDGEDDILPLVGVESSEDHSFGCVYSGSVLLAYCNSNQWQYSSFVIGRYTKPSGGIPKTDLAAAVQTSLGKADTALQQHQDISGKLDKNQGSTNAGKVLTVGSDGAVSPQEVAGGQHIWWTDELTVSSPSAKSASVAYSLLHGPVAASSSTVSAGDYVIGPPFPENPQYGEEITGDPLWLYTVTNAGSGSSCTLKARVLIPEAVDLSAYRTADDQDAIDYQLGQAILGKLDVRQGTAHAGEFLVVGSDGNVTTKTMSAWQGGNY